MVNEKCIRWGQAIVDSLTARLSAAYTITQSFDANGDLYVLIQKGAGPNNINIVFIKIAPAGVLANGAFDSLGLAQTVYTPHVASVLYDTTATVTTTERFVVQRLVTALGTRVDIYEKAPGAGNNAITDITTPGGTNWVCGSDNVNEAFGTLSNL